MQSKPSHRRTVLPAISSALGLLFVALLADAFVAPAAHEIHSPGATVPAVQTFDSIGVWWSPGKPTETLAEVKCSTHGPYRVDSTCSAGSVTQYFPTLRQTPQTLYLVWTGCLDASGWNIEYFRSSRTLVFHCYTARPWLYIPARRSDAAPLPQDALFAVPTAEIGAGNLTIVEDDRLEHLVGEQSTVSPMATVTIS